MGGRDAGGDEDGLDPCGVEGGRVVEKLAGAAELGGPGHPVGVSLGDDHAAMVGDFLFQGREVWGAVTGGEADLEVFPVDEKGDVAAANCWFNHLLDTSGLDVSGPVGYDQPAGGDVRECNCCQNALGSV